MVCSDSPIGPFAPINNGNAVITSRNTQRGVSFIGCTDVCGR